LKIAIISACAAIAGSIVGALASFFATRSLNSEQWRRQKIEKQILAREQLYSDFMAEAARLTLTSIDAKAEKASEFTALYSLMSRIRLIATPPVVTAAEEVTRSATNLHRSDTAKVTTHEPDATRTEDSFAAICCRELDELREKA
jgi:hypothetical protein